MKRAAPAVGLLVVLALSGCGDRSTSSVAVQVASGGRHACAVFEDGSARCWADLAWGVRGEGVTLTARPSDWLGLNELVEDRGRANLVINLTDAVEVAAGERHSCARRKDGTVWCWGDASVDRLGIDAKKRDVKTCAYPVRTAGVTDAVQVCVGDLSSCARRSDGSVWCWGSTSYGRLGRDGSRMPGPVPGVHGAEEIQCGGGLACARRKDGSVLCWGQNDLGQRGIGTADKRPVVAEPTPVGQNDVAHLSVGPSHACVRTVQDEVRCWGKSDYGRLDVPKEPKLRIVNAGNDATCGLTANGELWCWGRDSLIRSIASEKPEYGAAKIGVVRDANQLVLGAKHACVRSGSGGVSCWGASWRDSEDDGKTSGPSVPSGLGETVDLAANLVKACAVREDGTVVCWGEAEKLETVVGVSDATQVSLGKDHGCARLSSGAVTCWGHGDRGQLGRGLSEKDEALPAATVAGVGGVEQVAASDHATCARTKAGSVYCWGSNRDGELGQGRFSREGDFSAVGRPLPVRLPASAVDLQGGGATFCATLSGGKLVCWGDNESYQIVARPKERPGPAPTLVEGIKDAVQLAVGDEHACVRTKAGKVLCWGNNRYGQMGDGTWGDGNLRVLPGEVEPLSGATEVYVAYRSTCGRMAGGRVRCVGGMGPTVWELEGLEAATQISLSQDRMIRRAGADQPAKPSGCAVMSTGALACWGAMVAREWGESVKAERPMQVRW